MYFGNLISYRNTDRFSCFDNCIDFQCILFRQGFSGRFEYIYLRVWGEHSFSVYSLWEFLVVPKRTEVCFWLGQKFTLLRWMAVAAVTQERWLAIQQVSCLAPLPSFQLLTFSCAGYLPDLWPRPFLGPLVWT